MQFTALFLAALLAFASTADAAKRKTSKDYTSRPVIERIVKGR